jgi:PAS domain S-box-containing protein
VTLNEFARRHRSRGISLGDSLGNYKALIHSLEELILNMDETAEEKLAAINMLRRWSDGMSIQTISDWTVMGQFEAITRLAETNRELTLEKNKYENILEATSDLVLVTDPNGDITEANSAAKVILKKDINIIGQPLGKLLELDDQSIESILDFYQVNQHHEISLNKGLTTYSLRIIPSQTVSLTSRGYMVLLSDISMLTGQRESLKKEVTEYTTALADSEKQFMTLFQNAAESILLVNEKFVVVESNQRSSKIFDFPYERIISTSFFDLCDDDRLEEFKQSVKNLETGQNWEGELTGKRSDETSFPMVITTSRIELETGPVFMILVKDISKRKDLENNLIHERNQAQEMNITLRNVLGSIKDENFEQSEEMSDKVKTSILPTLDKIENESNLKVRSSYLNSIKEQLVRICGESSDESGNIHLYKPTPSELRVCQNIKDGYSTKEIAEKMGLSIDTIQTHRKNIRKKL